LVRCKNSQMPLVVAKQLVQSKFQLILLIQ
jgi:hypothetical protein